MKKIKLILISFIIINLCSCTSKVDPFEIGIDHIGALTKTSTINDLETIYAKDSIAKHSDDKEFIGNANEIEIYDDKGALLLILETSKNYDSTSTIKAIRVIDPRFKTDKGIGISSSFKEVRDTYTISRITNSLSLAVAHIDELKAALSINKKELPDNLRFDTNSKIEAVQIPDTASIKYFWLDWE